MGGSRKINILVGEGLKRGAWTFCRFKKGLCEKKVVVSLRGLDILMHTMDI